MTESKRITAFCIAVILIFCSLPLFVFGAGEDAEETGADLGAQIDYTDGSESYKELSVADLLRSTASVTLTDAEKEYFSAREIALKYNDNIPEESVSYKNTDGGFLVTASPYSYEASNGVTVDWIPAYVTVNGAKKTFSDGVYEALFAALKDGETYEIQTAYTAQITVPVSVLKALAGVGYDEGRRVVTETQAYEDALALYESETEKYESDYAEYVVRLDEYTAYVDALAHYNADKAEYDAYTAAKERYDVDYAAWLAYSEAYEIYEKEYAEYEEKNAVYEDYYKLYAENYAALSACRSSLEVLESIFISDSEGHTMYGTLKGDTVAQVVARRDELVDYGIKKEYLDDAGESTERLKTVLTPYNNLKTEKERFEYYQANYEEIKSQFTRLYSALHSLANAAMVRMELSKRGKLDRYYEFVAQLYVISAGLDDEVTLSDEWNVRGKTVNDVLESVQFVADRDSSDPAGLTYPEYSELPDKPVRPEEPEKVEKPQLDYEEEVTEPIGPPDEVEEPVEPEKPTVVRPEEPEFTAEELLLAEEVKNGTLKQRAFGSSRALNLKTSVLHTEAPELIRGDVNRDKAVNNKDVVALFKAVSNVDFVYDRAYDFDENGAVNNKDVVALFKYVSGIFNT